MAQDLDLKDKYLLEILELKKQIRTLRLALEQIADSRTGIFQITSSEGHQNCIEIAEKALQRIN